MSAAMAMSVSIIDDDPQVRDAVGNLVRSLGYMPAVFASADDFLRSDKVWNSSCIITDLRMAGLSGAALQARLIAEDNPTPVIVMTAFADDAVCARVLQVGAVGVLKKPFDDGALVQCLARAIERGEAAKSGTRTGRLA